MHSGIVMVGQHS